MDINWREVFYFALPAIERDFAKQLRVYSSIVFTRVEEDKVVATCTTTTSGGGSSHGMNFPFKYLVECAPQGKLKKTEYYSKIMALVLGAKDE